MLGIAAVQYIEPNIGELYLKNSKGVVEYERKLCQTSRDKVLRLLDLKSFNCRFNPWLLI